MGKLNKSCFFLLGSCLFALLTAKAGAEIASIPDDTQLTEALSSAFLREAESEPSLLGAYFIEPTRITLAHEISFKVEDPGGLKNDRSSLRLEYARPLLQNFHLLLDDKITAFWRNDHRAEAGTDSVFMENDLIEAVLQISVARTSIKIGKQKMIWGESDAGAVTDVISPRDYSELFFISLEESRIGQPMVALDQFTSYGDWSFFYIPEPEFNLYPRKGSAYYYDPFSGGAVYQEEVAGKEEFEYGLRWKKTYGKSDISIMTASVIDNDYAYRLDGLSGTGQLLLTKVRNRYSMAGMTFNYGTKKILFKGELALKSRKAFNDASYQIVSRDAVDASLAMDYSPGGGAYTLSLEAVNNHIVGWDEEIQGMPENAYSLVLGWRNMFLNDDLSVMWTTIYSEPYTSYLHSLLTSYKWGDHIATHLNAYYPDIRDDRNVNWIYRDQKQVVFKILYQF